MFHILFNNSGQILNRVLLPFLIHKKRASSNIEEAPFKLKNDCYENT